MKKFNKILLVEDQEIDAFLTEKVLLLADVADGISICRDGEEALAYIRDICQQNNMDELIPELILLDINMPRMNGIEFLHELRQKYEKNFTVVILSSSENPQDIILSAK